MTVTNLVIAAALCPMLFEAVVLWYQQEQPWHLLALSWIILALMYDNLIVGVGELIEPGEFLLQINYPRYLLHALLTPLLILVGLQLSRNAGVKWARRNSPTSAFFIIITVLMTALGTFTEWIMLDLQPLRDGSSWRYVNRARSGPPIPVIVVDLLLWKCGISIHSVTEWHSALVLGPALMMVAPLGGTLVTNAGEAVLMMSLTSTARQFPCTKNPAQDSCTASSRTVKQECPRDGTGPVESAVDSS